MFLATTSTEKKKLRKIINKIRLAQYLWLAIFRAPPTTKPATFNLILLSLIYQTKPPHIIIHLSITH